VSFPEAVRLLAHKFGVSLPEVGPGEKDTAAENEALLKMHEVAAAFYRDVLGSSIGERGRDLLWARGVQPETVARLGYGFAPPGRDALFSQLRRQGFPASLTVRSGLVVERDGRFFDRFWNRLMIPIARESGAVVAFGGRAMDAEQVPKYLNSPETPIYSKGRTLYGLDITRGEVSKRGYAVLVEGYFDFAQAWQAGVTPVVATCGTALTKPQAEKLRRFASRAVLSFDPDAAGQAAAVRSCDLLVAEGFQVSVALLPRGQDPDGFVRERGGTGYQAVIDASQPYLDFLIDQSAARHDLTMPAQRLAFLNAMLTVAATIPEAAARDQFADRLSHRAGIAEEVVRTEIRRAAVARRTAIPARRLPGLGDLVPAERDLLARLWVDPAGALAALAELDPADLEGLSGRHLLEAARDIARDQPEHAPARLQERLSEQEVALLTGLAARLPRPAPAAECVAALKHKRFERERLKLQRQIDTLQEQGRSATDAEIDQLLARKIQEARAAQTDMGVESGTGSPRGRTPARDRAGADPR
jgi:DNA primase